jgi:hypothetical protein
VCRDADHARDASWTHQGPIGAAFLPRFPFSTRRV